MGLDVFRDGGCAVRVPVQRHLILWFGLFFSSLAVAGFPPLPDGAVVIWDKAASKDYYDPPGMGKSPSETMWPQAEAYRDSCESQHPDKICYVEGFDDDPQYLYDVGDQKMYRVRGGVRMVASPVQCEAYQHEKNPITGEQPLGECSCATGWTDAGANANPRCQLPDQEPEECRENGQVHNPENGLCQLECEHGELNGACLPPPEEDNECTNDSPDYRGEIVTGYGTSPVKMCGDYDQCSGDKPGQVGFVNGELRCIAEDYGVPKCKSGTIGVIDNYGFACQTLENQPEEPDTPEDPNTDTDGDGEPDEYDRTNDPESVEKGLDKIEKAIKEGNAKTDTSNGHLGKIENAVKSIADDVSSLEQMGKNGELAGGGGGGSGGGEGLKNPDGEDYLGDLADIKQNTRDSADGVADLNEKLETPEGGFNTDSKGDAPTFGESVDRMQLAITQHPTIEAVTTIPSIASNNTCPVWTIPATPVWDAMPLDSHCAILEDHRGLLSILFIAAWTLAAVFVFLRA